jgi:hypothetical protein
MRGYVAKGILTRVGFEPTPFRTSVLGLTLSWRLRPLGHLAFVVVSRALIPNTMTSDWREAGSDEDGQSGV